MRKLLLICTAFFVFMIIYPNDKASAGTSNFGDKAILKGLPVLFHGWSILNLTDGLDGAYTDFSELGNLYTIDMPLPKPEYVSRVYVRVKGNREVSAVLTFEDGTTEQIDITTGYVNGVPYGDWADFYGVVVNTETKVTRLKMGAKPMTSVTEVDLERGVANVIDPTVFVIDNLKSLVNSPSSITLNWSMINSSFLKGYKVYKDDVLISDSRLSSLSINSLVPGETNVFKVIPYDVYGLDYAGSTISYFVPLPDVTAPSIPVNLQVVPDRYTATVRANNVVDADLAGYHVFLDGVRVTTSPVLFPYVIKGLSLDTNYDVQIASIDLSGNISDKSVKVNFKTLNVESVPVQVTSLMATPFNSGASLSWIPVSSAKKYKVFKNGQFLLETNQSNIKIKDLVNGQQVTFYVVAMNDIGDSEPSNTVAVIPLISLPPDVSLGYELTDVAGASSYWFSSIWLILAFSISIPLAFYIGNRVKGLFVA